MLFPIEIAALKQYTAGRTRLQTTDGNSWDLLANGTAIELQGVRGGIIIHRLRLDASAVTSDGLGHTLALREIDVCDNGTAKKMLILASVPY